MKKSIIGYGMFLFLILSGAMTLTVYGEEALDKHGVSQTALLLERPLPNGGFEELGENNLPAGWTIIPDAKKPDVCVAAIDSACKHSGKNSLKLTVKEEVENVSIEVRSKNIIPAEGKLYRLTGWVKQENFFTEREVGYAAISLRGPLDYWNWRIGITPRKNFDWRFVEKLVGPVTNEKELAITLLFNVYKGKPVIWFDDLRIQEYSVIPTPDKPKTWVYPTRQFGVGGNIVDDQDGNGGKAFKITTLDGTGGGKIQGPVISDQPAGIYRAIYRLKINDKKENEPFCQLDIIVYPQSDVNASGSTRVIWIDDFKEVNKYQDFAIDFILPARGIGTGLSYGISGTGALPDLFIDKVTVMQLLEFSDEEMEEFYGD